MPITGTGRTDRRIPIRLHSGRLLSPPRSQEARVTIRQGVLDYIAARDHRVMRKVNHWRAPRLIRLWALYATRGGDGWLWYLLALFLFLFGGEDRVPALTSMGVSASVGIAFFLYVKRTFRRRRPCAIEPHCWAHLLPPDQFSFPSGHTIVAFGCAVPVALFYPSHAIAVLFCALSIAISRILLGMHFLSDVLAGALVGGLLGYGSYLVFG